MSDMNPHPVGDAANQPSVLFFRDQSRLGRAFSRSWKVPSRLVGDTHARLGVVLRSPFSVFTEVRSMSRSRVRGCRSRALAFTTTTVHELTASVYLIAFSFSTCCGAPPLIPSLQPRQPYFRP